MNSLPDISVDMFSKSLGRYTVLLQPFFLPALEIIFLDPSFKNETFVTFPVLFSRNHFKGNIFKKYFFVREQFCVVIV